MKQDVKILLNGISVVISETTSIEVSPFNEDVTMEDLNKNRQQIEKKLKRTVDGIMMNFSPSEGFDVDSPQRKSEISTEIVEGNTNGGFCVKVSAKGTVDAPDRERVKSVLENKMKPLKIVSMTFDLELSGKDGEVIPGLRNRCYQKVQEQYLILAYDEDNGMTVRLKDDFFITIFAKEDNIKLTVFTKYDFQFERCMKDFSVDSFIMNLIRED